MKLTRRELEDILQIWTIDPGNGTLYDFRYKCEVARDRLMLVIGVGGCGRSAILETMKIARQRLNDDFSNYVKFIAIDSSSYELVPLKQMGIDVLNISSPGALERLAPNARNDFYKKFIPREYPYYELDNHPVMMKRLHCKVRLYDSDGNGSTNDSVLTSKIGMLFTQEWEAYKDLPVDIIIISGISGGTGGGTVINVAALARAACPTECHVSVHGYLMMPDTTAHFSRDDQITQRMYANGYATLKEIESIIGDKELLL